MTVIMLGLIELLGRGQKVDVGLVLHLKGLGGPLLGPSGRGRNAEEFAPKT